jgi:uracil-DNA glycosylase
MLQPEFDKPYFAELVRFVRAEYAHGVVYPPGRLIFAAFDRTPFDRVKVVVLGQDPYHEPGQAQGLAFYVPPNVRTPPSLLNIAKELADEYPERAGQGARPAVPDLLSWADQGVLLLNATLTVSAGLAGSHQGKGWETFTDAVVKRLAEEREHLVFILWGSYAQRKGAVIDRSRHLVLASAHPSPLSAMRGFFGCGHFRAANEYLARHGAGQIAWL